MANSKVIEITVDNWKTEVLDSTISVLVDFWGDWCSPCKAIVPTRAYARYLQFTV